ncbi:tRNA pseudouridine(55) synthase TruB [Candidatus Magnetominusculus dajiuhuensis]|uniref:tRNA pseudouridine(55) synthase TruB n=1 Tax=Candidatus Magnetominusculus dajiuhuensis TaxID=3137712 RepID=UPI003B43661D
MINGAINFNKPEGISSHTAVQRIKAALKLGKAGHAGTLDPLAEGVLIVLCGNATKLTPYLATLDKKYNAVVKLGEHTETLDREGKVVRTAPISGITAEGVEEALKAFTGVISQTPPMYSALKINGTPLYKLARKGLEVERKQRTITIFDITLTAFDLPYITLALHCSKGTYVRSLCSDLAESLGSCGYVHALKRTGVGMFNITGSCGLDTLESARVLSMDETLCHLVERTLTPDEQRKILNGSMLDDYAPDRQNGEAVRLKDIRGNLFGIGTYADKKIKIATFLGKSRGNS